jgi:hypothetical protein
MLERHRYRSGRMLLCYCSRPMPGQYHSEKMQPQRRCRHRRSEPAGVYTATQKQLR